MIDFTDIHDDLERTQRLPILTPELQLKEALKRERTAKAEIVELLRQNTQMAKDLARLRGGHHPSTLPPAQHSSHGTERPFGIEEQLFEVCGALKTTLSRVLGECEAQHHILQCGAAAARTLEQSCDQLERILCAPGFHADRAAPQARASDIAAVMTPQATQPASRSRPIPLRKAPVLARPHRASRVTHVGVVRPEA